MTMSSLIVNNFRATDTFDLTTQTKDQQTKPQQEGGKGCFVKMEGKPRQAHNCGRCG